MKMSASEIITEARTSWIEPSEAFITATEALRWLNQAVADFVRRTKSLRYTWDFPTVALQQDYPFPESARLMQLLYVLCEGEKISPCTIDELDSWDTAWRYAAGGDTGEPKFYYVSGIHDSELGFYHCPDDIYTIRAVYVISNRGNTRC